MGKQYNHNGLAGCVSQHRAHESGSLIGIYNAEQAEMDADGGAWVTFCEDHGTIVNHRTLKLARHHGPDSPTWCEDCQRRVRGAGNGSGSSSQPIELVRTHEDSVRCSKMTPQVLPPLSPEEIKIANATSRSAGAVGANALVPGLVRERLLSDPHMSKRRVLDYGAGKRAFHAQLLRIDGLFVTAYDMGANFDPYFHDATALQRQYDVVYASNVLNTLASKRAVIATIREIRGATKALWGYAVVNYPESPRKCEITVDGMRRLLERRFRKVERSDVSPSNRPVWICWP